jgi:two-component system NtrC family sensor kinase
VNELLVIAGDRIRADLADVDVPATFVDTLDDAVRFLETGGAQAVLVDLRLFDVHLELLCDRLEGVRPGMLPIIVLLPDGDTENLGIARKRGLAWVMGEWVDSHGSDTLEACLRGVSLMFDKLDTLRRYEEQHEQLVRAEKFAAVGLLAAEIAHEINNPSTFVITNLSVMKDYVDTLATFHQAVRRRLDDGPVDADAFGRLEDEYEIEFLEEDLQPLLDRSLAGLNRIHQIVQDLRYFSRERTTESRPIRVAGLVEASVNLVRHEARYRTKVTLDLADDPPLVSDANRLSQVILNLLLNAVQSIEPGNPAENEVRVTTRRRSDFLEISVSDTGVGIEQSQLERVFEPFYTTREPGEGTGLGLSISRDIMRAIGGDIEVESEPRVGSTFTLKIPLTRDDGEQE